MLKADAVKQRLDLFDPDFSIGRCNGKQLTAGEFLRRTTLIDVDVRRFGTNDGLMRLRYCLKSQYIRARAAENKKDLYIFPQVLMKLFQRSRGVRIVAIGNHMAVVGGGDSLHHARMNAGVVVTRKASGWPILFCHFS